MRPDERAALVAELFDAALEQPTAERAAFLAQRCGTDAAVRAEVESLLKAAARADGFMDAPAAAMAIEAAGGAFAAGEIIGDYEIISLLGKGGMGEVYLGHDRRLQRRVALKLVRRGLDTAQMLRRFEREQQLLAGLNHANIAQLYATGVTPDGIPYFAMEYVEGVPLNAFAEQRSLGVRERLELFRKICSAVGYAHQHLVVHRDIKPANIRVTPDGEPKLLDFGIAKLLDDLAADAPEQTVTMQRMLTPEYASPEQVRGERISTASDIYSLGVVLYELLTGQKPYRLTSRRPEDVERAIAEQEPARPSTASGSPRSIRGDVDNIILTAMRKEPERRYASVAQLADDIRRYLEGRPVVARKPTFAYRAGKFMRRNKAAVAAATLVVLTLSGGIVATSYEARKAQRRFEEVRRLANSLMFEIHDSVQDLPGSTAARQLIVQRALQYLDSLNSESGSDVSLQRELATAYEKVGDIQGNPYTSNLGDTDGALASYRKAAALRERSTKSSDTAEARTALARGYRGIGDIMEQKGDIAECLRNYRHSLALLEQVASAYPQDRTVQDELARARETLGDGLGRTQNHDERIQAYRQALSIRERLLQTTPADPMLRRGTAIALMKVAGVPGVAPDEAINKMQQAIAMLESLAAADPQNARARREVGYAYYRLGLIQSEEQDHTGSLTSRLQALAIRQDVASQDPKNRQARFDLATSHGELAVSYANVNAPADALQHGRSSLEILSELVATDPKNAVYQRNLGLCYERLGDAWALRARDERAPPSQRAESWREARVWYGKAADLFADLRTRGALMPTDAHNVEKFTAKAADADQAIAGLTR